MTVSKVVRGCADVGAETRSRVLARIKELNYQPNWVARSLAARRTFIIGLIVPDLMHSFFAEIAKGVSAAIRPLGYDVVICNSEEEARSNPAKSSACSAARWTVWCSPPPRPRRPRSVRAHRSPRRSLRPDRPPLRRCRAPYVGADDEAIGRLATRHLIERGCRRIAHIAGPPLTPGVGRLKGYQDALAAAGISSPNPTSPRQRRCHRISAARRLLAPTRAPTPSSGTTIPPPPAP